MLTAVVQHEGEEAVVGLDFDRLGPADLHEPPKERQRPTAMDGQDVEFGDNLFLLGPDTSHRAVAHDPTVKPQEVGIGPASAMPGIEDNLAVHLFPIELVQGQCFFPRHAET